MTVSDLPEFDEHVALVAAAFLLKKGHTTEGVREYGACRQGFGYMWSAIADAMDALLGEGCAR